jgi:ribose-phosphate pyrophosphokinase
VARVSAAVVHAIFAPGALETLAAAGVEPIASSDTIAHPSNRIPVAPLVAARLGERA